MSKIVAIYCVAYALATQTAIAEGGRGALWQVVWTCVANHVLTGAAFPCLEVNMSDGEERGYVILRPPIGAPDIILSPTRKIVGVEDPSLAAVDAPNYFEDAWSARSFLSDAVHKPLAHDAIAVAVNSRFSRNSRPASHPHWLHLSGSETSASGRRPGTVRKHMGPHQGTHIRRQILGASSCSRNSRWRESVSSCR